MLLLLPAVGLACGDDPATVDPGPFDLEVLGNTTFRAVEGETVRVAVLRTDDGSVVARDRQEIIRGATSSFSFTFDDVLESGIGYRVVYWVDANFGGGAPSVCEGIVTDDHGMITVTAVTGDTSVETDFEFGDAASTCEYFTASLTFQGDATFQGAHGGQDVMVALLDATGVVADLASGRVSGGADPAFSFTFDGLADGAAFVVRYWIDSNFGGGSEGVCDPPENDHQWSVDLGVLEGDLTHTEEHSPGSVDPVCETFTADLAFAGDATFGGAHGNQTVTVGVVDDQDRLLAVAEETVEPTGSPSFSFDFPELLVIGRSYRVDYWIDSNFEGGTEGACDAPVFDHQWRAELGTVVRDVSATVDHDPAEQTEVCATFE